LLDLLPFVGELGHPLELLGEREELLSRLVVVRPSREARERQRNLAITLGPLLPVVVRHPTPGATSDRIAFQHGSTAAVPTALGTQIPRSILS